VTGLPPGTPTGDQMQGIAAPVWCCHAVEWRPEPGGYRPQHTDPAHPDLLCRDPGAIPETCQPVTAYDPRDYPNAGPAAVRAVLTEQGINPEEIA
jgi:hypothetical protein